MSDCSWAQLHIGGPVDRGLITQLLADEESGEYDLERTINEGDDDVFEEGLSVVSDDRGPFLQIMEDQQPGGMWEWLEHELVRHGIPFDRINAPCTGAWSDGKAAFRPGMTRLYETISDDSNGDFYVSTHTLRHVLQHLPQRHFRRRLRAWLDREHPTIPRLPPIDWLRDLTS